MPHYECPRCHSRVDTDRPTFCPKCQRSLQAFADDAQSTVRAATAEREARERRADELLAEDIERYHRRVRR